jgi:hypothetical protein
MTHQEDSVNLDVGITELELPNGDDISLERSAQIYEEYTGIDFDTGEPPLIERPERVKAPWQVLVILLPGSKRDHVVGQIEIFQVGGEEVYDERGTRSPLGGNVKLYWCPHCKLPVLPEWHSEEFAVCQHCMALTKPKDLIGEVVLSHTPRAAASIIRRAHLGLQFADFYFMRFISLPKTLESGKMTGKDVLDMDKALYERVCVLYPFHKLAAAVHAKNSTEESLIETDFELALENEIRRYL